MPSLTHRPAAAKAKKQVRFNTTVRGIFFETSTDNHERMWYSPKEFRDLQEMLQTDIRFLRSLRRKLTKHPHVPLSAAEHAALDATTIQGVEHLMSKKTFADRDHQQRAVIHAVLAEQQRQKFLGRSSSSFDGDKLALVSSALSFETRHRALADGRRCADEVIYEL
mmetsp:Transcript_17986/g.42506  ORF Transcript_17986/g.42506 Transcript_17986/m.42506 type:complete len:166 (+) Transcript_17986:121-618(+)